MFSMSNCSVTEPDSLSSRNNISGSLTGPPAKALPIEADTTYVFEMG